MGRRGAGAAGLAAGAALAVVALAGCGGPAQPAPLGGAPSSSSTAGAAAPVWPVAELTVVTTPKGQRAPLGPLDLEQRPDLAWYVEEEGLTVEEAAVEAQDQETYTLWSERALALVGDRYSAHAWGDPDDDSVPPWVAYTGDEPPEGLLALAEELPFSVELRGGAVLSDAERERVLSAGIDAFSADVGERALSSGGLDAPTGAYSIAYVPDGAAKRADDTTAAAVVAATLGALGRDAPITVEFHPDDRDPRTTEPAFWYLPAGWVADPTATSVEVVVDSPQCASGVGPGERMAPPEVEVTDTQVRIAVSTYILKGTQSCLGHGTAPLVVDLGQPLGDRTLVDVFGAVAGGHAPPDAGLVVPAAG